ncbi:50S ribosomal protein L3 [bacterium]
MMKYLIGTKIGMTRIFHENGNSSPVTVIKIDDCWIVGKKTKEKDGYDAVQIGYGVLKEKKATKPYKGLFKNIKSKKIPRMVREFKIDASAQEQYELGTDYPLDIFTQGDYVDVSGISKGKGFAGVMKRHGFHGLPASHGHGEYRRAPGSIGASSYPSRVFKGKKMPGHMGVKKVSVQKLEIAQVDSETRVILIKGAVPGINGAVLGIKETVKSKKKVK